jgi:hypothetical protein
MGRRYSWKVSAAWAAMPHECNLAGILQRCGGACCWSKTYWPPQAFTGTNEHGLGPDPVRGQPCGHLGPQGCTLSDADKPVICLLYPLRPNPQGTLIKHQRSTYPLGVCKGNHGHGPPLIDAVRSGLVALFGEAQVDRVRAAVMAGHDSYFAIPPQVWAAWEDEGVRAEDGRPPRLRSEYAADLLAQLAGPPTAEVEGP